MTKRTVLTIITGVFIILIGAFIILIKPPNNVTTAIVRVFCDDAEKTEKISVIKDGNILGQKLC